MKRIIISGYYGFGNTGDEAILSSMMLQIRNTIPDCNFTVISNNIEETKRLHGVDAINRMDFSAISNTIEKSDLVILGGGGLFQNNDKIEIARLFNQPGSGVVSYAIVPLIAKMYNKRILYYAQGVGPLFAEEARTFVAFIAELADIITVRDRVSENLLIDIGVSPLKIVLGLDPAFGIDIPSGEIIDDILIREAVPTDKEIICVSVRWWIDRSIEEKYIKVLQESLDNLLTSKDFVLLFVPFQNVEGCEDTKIAKEIIDGMKNKDRCYILKYSYHPRDIAGIISKAKLVIGMRYHSIIFSILSKTPFVALSYDPKVANLVDEFGLAEYCIDIDSINSININSAIDKIIIDTEKIQKILENTLEKMKKRLIISQNLVQNFVGDTMSDFKIDTSVSIEKIRLFNTIINSAKTAIDLQRYYQQTILGLESQLKEKDDVAHSLEFQLKERDDVISAVKSQLKEKDDTAHYLESQLKEKNDIVTNLQEIIRQRENSISWRLSQFYGRYFGKVPLLTRSISYAFGKMNKGYQKNKEKNGTNLKYHVFKNILKVILPKNLYLELGKDYILADNSKVVLYYTDSKILPTYPHRILIDKNSSSSIKVSLIVTVKNEEKTARKWLDSIQLQTRVPDELIIVDGGSKDRTVGIIREFATSSSINISLINSPGSNIAEGRNLAIKNAKYDIIACTDFGNVLDKYWLELITAPFGMDKNIDVSAGFYKPLIESQKDVLVSKFFIPDINSINPQHFLPASKSVAFKKAKWAMVDGYPTWLTYAAEDTLFDCELKRTGGQWAFVPEAIVYWKINSSFTKIFKTVYRYAKGDGEAGLFGVNYRNSVKTLLEKFPTLFGIGLLCGLGVYLIGIKLVLELIGISILTGTILLIFFNYFDINTKIKSRIISATITAAQTTGFIMGTINRPNIRKRKSDIYIYQLNDIIKKYSHAKGIVIYPPTHDWGFMFQRPHQMARSFAKQNYLYFFCTNNELTDMVYGFKEVEPFLYVCNVLLETFSILKNPIVYIGSAWNRQTIPIFSQPQIIYDHYDDLEVSTARIEDHIELLKSAKVVLVTADKLVNNVIKYRQDILLTPNGVDYEMIHKNRPSKGDDIPNDLKPILYKNKKIVGYSGALAKWFDYDLLEYLAKTRSDLEFVLVGVNYDGSVDKSNILKYENIHWLGMKSYDELFKYVWSFDIAIIPFKINNVTIATSPIKLFEYMACSKPVVTTALPECKKYNGVFVADNYEQFIDYIDKALVAKKDLDYLFMIDKVARDNTWDNRVNKIITELQRKRNDGNKYVAHQCDNSKNSVLELNKDIKTENCI